MDLSFVFHIPQIYAFVLVICSCMVWDTKMRVLNPLDSSGPTSPYTKANHPILSEIPIKQWVTRSVSAKTAESLALSVTR